MENGINNRITSSKNKIYRVKIIRNETLFFYSHEIYLDKLSHKSIFPTKDNRWVSLDDHPLISDNDDIAQLFSEVNNIPLIDSPSSDSKQRIND